MEFDTLNAAIDSLPTNAVWSSSFGLQTQDGCVIVYRANGRRYEVSNGSHNAFAPFAWNVREMEG